MTHSSDTADLDTDSDAKEFADEATTIPHALVPYARQLLERAEGEEATFDDEAPTRPRAKVKKTG